VVVEVKPMSEGMTKEAKEAEPDAGQEVKEVSIVLVRSGDSADAKP
jgi:hypothetical protein